MQFYIPKDFIYYSYLNSINKDLRETHILDLLKFAIDNNYIPVTGEESDEEESLEEGRESSPPSELSEIKTELYKLGLDVSSLTSLLGSGTKRGKIAENVLIDNLFKFLPDSEICCVGYKAGKGDISICYKDYNIMIEVKNYNNNVSTKEKNKFHRDLSQNNYDAGIMLSCRSGIVGCSERFLYRNIEGKLVIYLSTAGSDGMAVLWAVLFITSVLDTLRQIKKDADEDEDFKNKQLQLIMTYIQSRLLPIENCINTISNLTSNIYDIKSDINRILVNRINSIEPSITMINQVLGNMICSFKQLLDNGTLPANMNLMSFIDEEKPLRKMLLPELREVARKMGIKHNQVTKSDLLKKIEKRKEKRAKKKMQVDDI